MGKLLPLESIDSDETSVPADAVHARVALYSHDTMGLGHLRRNLLIAGVLSQPPLHMDVLVISGAREACHFAMMQGVDCVTLPALYKDCHGSYTSKHLRTSLLRTTALRSKLIASAIDAFAPDLFVVDNVPRGIGGELDAAFELIRRGSATRCVLGLREVLDDPATVAHQWSSSNAEDVIRDHFDEVWIYGDANVYDSISEYSFARTTAERSAYTGYLDQRRRHLAFAHQDHERRGDESTVVCVVGGGQDGVRLASAFAAVRMPSETRGILITGPFMPAHDRQHLQRITASRDDLVLIEEIVEADHYISRADRVISMAGYNTISSILSFGKPALVVPRVKPRREQWIRAQMLEQRHALTMLSPNKLTSHAIEDWLRRREVPSPSNASIDLGGLDRIVDRVTNLLPQCAAKTPPKLDPTLA